MTESLRVSPAEQPTPPHITSMRATNLALRFLLELTALAALGYWGATRPGATGLRVALGAGPPLLAALFWGTFVAPRARVVLPSVVRMALGLAVFACAAVALADRAQRRLAVAFALASVVNVILMLAWRQDHVVPSGRR